MKKLSLILLISIILSACFVDFSSEVTHYVSAVWSDDDTHVLFTIWTAKRDTFFFYSNFNYYDSRFQLATINPDGSNIVKLNVSGKEGVDYKYYMKNSGYILFRNFDCISVHYLGSVTKILVPNTKPPSGEYSIISAVPSPNGEIIAIISPLPWCESLGIFTNQCVGDEASREDERAVHIRFVDSQTLSTISEYTSNWSSLERLRYRWDIDETFMIRDNNTNLFYRINPSDSTYTVSTESSNFSFYPCTTSSEYSRDNKKVIFPLFSDELEIVPNTEDLGDSPFID